MVHEVSAGTFGKVTEMQMKLDHSKSLNNKLWKIIEEQLNIILDMLVKEHRIKKYEFIGKFNYKFIKAEELVLKIYFNKYR